MVGLREDPAEAWIGSMWIAPDHRGRGAAGRMLETAIAWAGAAGAERIRLAVTVGNRAAERLYSSAGFVDTGERGVLREGSTVAIAWLERSI